MGPLFNVPVAKREAGMGTHGPAINLANAAVEAYLSENMKKHLCQWNAAQNGSLKAHRSVGVALSDRKERAVGDEHREATGTEPKQLLSSKEGPLKAATSTPTCPAHA